MALRTALEAIARMGSDDMTDREARGQLALAVALARLELAMTDVETAEKHT